MFRDDDGFLFARIIALVTAAAMFALGATWAVKARAHDWYPQSCCSDTDCKPVPDAAVRFTPAGWLIVRTGEVWPFSRARPSPDGQFHRCSHSGLDEAGTICLFVPGQGS